MSLDQFYTKPDIAKSCYNDLLKQTHNHQFDIFLEPSAGNGVFYKLLPENKRQGIDIDPKDDNITEQDFFDYVPVIDKKYIVIGNPPFGKNSSLALKFFNKAAEFADMIAFILPRTFKRVSITNKLSMNFHNIYCKDLPTTPCCFEPVMSAKCCFMIWEKKSEPREPVIYDKIHPDFEFLKHGPPDDNKQPTVPEGADFVLKAYGSNCGEIKTENLQNLRPKSWHWIKSNIAVEVLIERFKSLDYSISKDTVRQDSLGQQELIYLYKCKL